MSVAYSYSFLFNEKSELAIGAGVTVMEIEAGLFRDRNLGIIRAETGVTAQLPTFGLRGGYAFTDKLHFKGSAGVFSFDLAVSNEEELGGQISSVAAGLYHNTFEHVRLGLIYYYFDVDVDWGNASGFTSLRYTYHGPALSLAATF